MTGRTSPPAGRDPEDALQRRVWKARTVAELDAIVAEASARVKAALLDIDGPGQDWEASTALDNAASAYDRMLGWPRAPRHFRKASDEAGIEAAADERLARMTAARARAMAPRQTGRHRS